MLAVDVGTVGALAGEGGICAEPYPPPPPPVYECNRFGGGGGGRFFPATAAANARSGERELARRSRFGFPVSSLLSVSGFN